MKKDNIKLLFWVFLLLIIIFIMCFTSHAATSRKKLPYFVDFNSSTYFDVDLKDFHDQLVALGFPNPSNKNYIVYLGDFYNYDSSTNSVLFDVYYMLLDNSDNNYGNWRFYGLYNSNDSSTPVTNRIGPDSFDWQTNYVVFRCSVGTNSTGTVARYTYRWNIAGKYPYLSTQNPNGRLQSKRVFLSGKTAMNKNSYGFTSSVPIWYRYNDGPLMSGSYRVDYTGGYDIYDSFEIYTFGTPIGVPIPPNINQDNIINPDSQSPTAPTITTYTPSTYNPPNFDNSSTTDALQSIYDIIIYNGEYIIENVTGAIGNLTNNIKNYFEYLKESIDYGMQKIINNIKNGIQNMFDNIQNFFAPVLEDIKDFLSGIKSKIDYISEPIDQDVIWDNISTTSLVSNINIINTSLNSFQSAFTGVSEPNEYKIPIHLENLPSSWFGTQTTQYIDLGIINGTVKDGLRLFVWAMVTYGLVVTIFDSIANYINGGGDES